MSNPLIRVTPEFLKHLYDTYDPPEPEKRCPTCGINPMSTGPWGQCGDCIRSEDRPTSLGDTTGETNDGSEGMDYGRTWSDYDY